MAKTIGGVRGNSQSAGERGYIEKEERKQRRYAFNFINQMGNAKQSDVYRSWDEKRLKKFIQLGKSYNIADKERAVRAYVAKAARENVKGNFINHANFSGERSELIRVGNAYNAYKNLGLYQSELKRRKRK